MQQAIFPIFYFPPISYCKKLIDFEEITFEKNENFVKQTYRNRCKILGANGTLNLVIPTHHNGKRSVKDIEISYAENWQKIHLKSIKTAYQTSPYFEFYESKFDEIFAKKDKFLIDYTLKTNELIFSLLKISPRIYFSEKYLEEYSNDFRNQFIAKETFTEEQQTYNQVFSDRFPFQKDLSILDLIFNLGTKSLQYLQNTI